MIRVFLVDDHTVLRCGLRILLSGYEDLEVVGESGDGGELLDCIAGVPMDVVVMDVRMPGMDGADMARRLQQQYPGVEVLGLSMATDPAQVLALLEAGFRGYVLKSAPLAEVVFAIRRVAQGLPFMCTELGMDVLKAVVKAKGQAMGAPCLAEEASRQQGLTRRELEVLQLVAAGLSNEEIAGQLFTSKRTIETHRRNLLAKTRFTNTAGLVHYAAQQGLV